MNKIKIVFISITVLIILIVGVLTLKNYFPDNAISVKTFPDNKYRTKEAPMILKNKIDADKIAVIRITSKEFDSLETQIKAKNLSEPRLFDDIMKATETFGPLVLPFITFYLYKKKKKIDKNVKDEDE